MKMIGHQKKKKLLEINGEQDADKVSADLMLALKKKATPAK
jgi:hypothetical protein